MTHPNSREAYLGILHSGKLSKRRAQVFEVLIDNPDSTANEVWAILNERLGILQDSVTPRFGELERQGIAERGETRICNITKRHAETWHVKEDATSLSIKKIKTRKSLMRIEMERVLDACQQGELEYAERLKIVARIAQEALI